jgi:glycosyltransferase involved in cell wall biosynthesis
MPQVRSIVQINTRDQRGGAERIAWNLFQAYRAQGLGSWLVVGKKYSHDPHVLEIVNAPYASTPWARIWLRWNEALSPLRQRDVKGVGTLQARLRLLAQPAAYWQQRQGYEDFAYPGTKQLFNLLPAMPDIIHCHNLHGDYFDLTALPWLSRQRPVILHLHDGWLLSGHCAHALDCVRWQTGCGACPYLQTYPAVSRDNTAANWQRKQEIYAASRFYIVTVSQWLMDKVQQSILSGVQERVIYNGIDLSIFKPGDRAAARRSLQLPPKARIVLFANHSTFKDVSTAQGALSHLQDLQGDGLLFIGLGRGGNAEIWGQGKVIRPSYVQTSAQMADYYRAADLYLHSTTADSFPTAILEAQACGTPVVATAVGGIPEQIKDGETGILTAPQDPQAMTNALQALLDDAELRRQMGQAASAHVHQRFGLAQQVAHFLAWYEEVYEDWQRHVSQAHS